MSEYKEQETSNRSGGVSNVVGDSKAVAQAAANKELHLNPPPLVHVDPATGIPIDKPFIPNTQPSGLTVPLTDKPTVAGNDPVRNAAAQQALDARKAEDKSGR